MGTWRGAPRPTQAPRSRVPVGPPRQRRPARLSAGETAEVRPAARGRPSAKRTSPPPAQGRISEHAALHAPRSAPGSEGGGTAGRRGALQPAAPQLEGRRQGPKAGGETPWDQTRPGRVSGRGSPRLRSPSRACPARCTNRSHIQGESSRVRPLPLPRLSAPEPMAGRGGQAGLRGGKPSRSHYPCAPSSVRTSAPEPVGLSPAAPAGAPGAPFSSGAGPLASPTLPRRPRGGGSSSGGRAGASPSRPVTRHPGSARPHPGSSLFPRRAPRSVAASSRDALRRFGPPLPARPGGPSGSVHWPCPNQGSFCLISRMRTRFGAGRRRCSQLGAGAGECPGRGRVEAAPGREAVVKAGAPGRTELESELWAHGPAGGQAGVLRAAGLRGDEALLRLPSEAPTRPFGPESPGGGQCARRCGPGRGRPRGLARIGLARRVSARPERLPGESSGGRAGASPPWWAQVGSAALGGGWQPGPGRVGDPRAS